MVSCPNMTYIEFHGLPKLLLCPVRFPFPQQSETKGEMGGGLAGLFGFLFAELCKEVRRLPQVQASLASFSKPIEYPCGIVFLAELIEAQCLMELRLRPTRSALLIRRLFVDFSGFLKVAQCLIGGADAVSYLRSPPIVLGPADG